MEGLLMKTRDPVSYKLEMQTSVVSNAIPLFASNNLIYKI